MKKLFKEIEFNKKTVGQIFYLIAAIATIIALGKNYIIGVGLFCAIPTWLWLKNYLSNRQLPFIPPIEGLLEIRPIKTIAEFDKIDKFYHQCFGGSSVPSEVLKSWWRRFPNGIVCIFKDCEIVGGLSMWPLNDDTFQKLQNGFIRERDIMADDISNTKKNKWYFSEIAIEKHNRRDLKILSELLKGALSIFEKEISNNFPITLLAEGYSTEGENLLKRRHFIEELSAEKTQDKLPVFSLTMNDKTDLVKLKGSIADFK